MAQSKGEKGTELLNHLEAAHMIALHNRHDPELYDLSGKLYECKWETVEKLGKSMQVDGDVDESGVFAWVVTEKE